MKLNTSITIILTLTVISCCSLAANTQTADQLEKLLRENPNSIDTKQQLAEVYLTQCQLERSLNLWRDILTLDPSHQRAKFVVSQLTAQALDLDTNLDIIETLIDKGQAAGTESLLQAASSRAATDKQKARILFLHGKLYQLINNNAKSRASFEAAVKIYPDTDFAARSAIELARDQWSDYKPQQAQQLLTSVINNTKIAPAIVRQADLKLFFLKSADWTTERKIDALQQRLRQYNNDTPDQFQRELISNIMRLTILAHGGWTPQAIDAAGSFLQTDPPYDQADDLLEELLPLAATSQDTQVIDSLLKILNNQKLKDTNLAKKAAFVRAEALLSRAVIESDQVQMKNFLAQADSQLNDIQPLNEPWEQNQLWQLRGRQLLIEAQKTVALSGPADALPAISKAKDYYMSALENKTQQSLDRLSKLAVLLEHIQQWQLAMTMYRELADRFAHTSIGRDMLLKVAKLHEIQLNDPMAALDVYAEYAARYPADLSYNQLNIGQRLQRLGYVNVLDFQKRMGLKPDGVIGPKTRNKIAELEEGFDMITLKGKQNQTFLRGEFIHPRIFNIARQLQQQGRHYDAIKAYLLFLNLYPTKKEADDSLLAVARLFRDNMLFEEAMGAYEELMEYFPNGNLTSQAYIESAACMENLGRWNDAKQLYELYIKKFPKYEHVKLCKDRIEMMDEINQFQQFRDDNPTHPKAAEAQYQIAAILHNKIKNYTKAAVEFTRVAQMYPTHVRASDGLFSAGAAYLKTENFPAARKVFEQLIEKYPQSRLADDAQYWIGHTYEYSARAIGKLDDRRIILKQRSMTNQTQLTADVNLRMRFYKDAKPGPQMPQDIWTTDALGVLTSGSKRDRVNADLLRAVKAYQKVVENFKMGDMAGNSLHRVGVIYTKYLKDPEKGFKAYQQLLDHYPGTKQAVDALFEVGAYYLEMQQYDQAVKFYQQFIYNYPTDARIQNAMIDIAQCYMNQKQWEKALDAYQSYLNKFPNGKQANLANTQVSWIRTYHY